jgi:hypothetical protein
MRKSWIVLAAVLILIAAGVTFYVTSQADKPVVSAQQPSASPVLSPTTPVPSISAASELPPEPAPKPYFGTFVSEAPASAPELAAAKKTIDEVRAAGLNTVYQYSFIQGTTALNKQYLDYAASQGVQVVIDLHDLYDGLDSYPQGGDLAGWLSVLSQNFGQHFTTTDEVVDYVVRTFESHPAVWGFSTSDEQPEGPEGLVIWSQLLLHRYQQIREITHKPVLLTMMGDQPRSFLKSLEGRGDLLATDYYPIGNTAASEADALTRISQDANRAGWDKPWAVLQAFDMRDEDYGMKDVATSSSHFPTVGELVQMGRQARAGGASGVLFFAWGSVQLHGQQATIKDAVGQLEPLYNE